MLLDLSSRQQSRALEHAVRSGASIEVEPRTWSPGELLQGRLAGRDSATLRIDLTAPPPHPLTSLVGAFCDARMTLGTDLVQFATCVIDVIEDGAAPRLLLATPESSQLANRRRFLRHPAQEGTLVSIRPAEDGATHVGELVNIGPDGLACRAPREEVDAALLIGDSCRLVFELGADGAPFDLAAVICNKAADPADRSHLIVGFEFDAVGATAESALHRLRAVLYDAAPDAPEHDA
ncbi:MAG: PilZ domain-containing protein [Planctomycetia bacterium]|nr:MAG: PilZ domain-containing protein [Planctomycetia bacterium]